MRAVAARRGLLSAESRPDPTPGPGRVVVKPVAWGICGSDLHFVETQAAQPEFVPPIVLGHEFAARLVDYGPDTDRRFELGTYVTSRSPTWTPRSDPGWKPEPVEDSIRKAAKFFQARRRTNPGSGVLCGR